MPSVTLSLGAVEVPSGTARTALQASGGSPVAGAFGAASDVADADATFDAALQDVLEGESSSAPDVTGDRAWRSRENDSDALSPEALWSQAFAFAEAPAKPPRVPSALTADGAQDEADVSGDEESGGEPSGALVDSIADEQVRAEAGHISGQATSPAELVASVSFETVGFETRPTARERGVGDERTGSREGDASGDQQDVSVGRYQATAGSSVSTHSDRGASRALPGAVDSPSIGLTQGRQEGASNEAGGDDARVTANAHGGSAQADVENGRGSRLPQSAADGRSLDIVDAVRQPGSLAQGDMATALNADAEIQDAAGIQHRVRRGSSASSEGRARAAVEHTRDGASGLPSGARDVARLSAYISPEPLTSTGRHMPLTRWVAHGEASEPSTQDGTASEASASAAAWREAFGADGLIEQVSAVPFEGTSDHGHHREGRRSNEPATSGRWLPRTAPVEVSATAVPQTSALDTGMAPGTGARIAMADGAPIPFEMPEPAENLSRLVQSVRLQARDGVSLANVRLNPEHLGEVTISVKLDAGVVTAVVRAEAGEVRQWLRGQEEHIRATLAEHGVTLDEFLVESDGRGQHRDEPDVERWRAPRRRQASGTRVDGDTMTFEVTA